MDQHLNEKRIYQSRDSALYERLESIMRASVNQIEIDGQIYDAAQDVDEEGVDYFILVPAV